MDLRQIARRCAPCGLLLLAVGCSDPLLGLEKPSAEPTLNLATQPSSRSQGHAIKPTKTRTVATAPAAPVGDIFMLYLVRDRSSVPTGPYAKAVALRRADPAKAVSLLDWLTEPSGQGGTTDRQFLVYADSVFLDWAADVAAMIDVRPAAVTSEHGPGPTSAPAVPPGADRLAQAVALVYTAANPTEIGRQAAENLVKSLESYCTQPGDPHRRWAACMLTGRLQEDVLGRRKQAVASFDRAAQLAQPSSPAWLVSRYRQADALYSAGSKIEARKIAQDIIKQSGQNYSHVRAYRQAEKLAAGTR